MSWRGSSISLWLSGGAFASRRRACDTPPHGQGEKRLRRCREEGVPADPDGSGLKLSSASEGQVTFEEYDPDSRVAGAITGLRMERDEPDDTIVVEIDDATFGCDS